MNNKRKIENNSKHTNILETNKQTQKTYNRNYSGIIIQIIIITRMAYNIANKRTNFSRKSGSL